MRRLLFAAVAGLVILGVTPAAVLADESTAETRADVTIANLDTAKDACLSSLEMVFEQAGFPADQVELAMQGFETILSQLVDPRITAIETALDSPDENETGSTPALDAAIAAGNALLSADQKSLTGCPVSTVPAELQQTQAGSTMQTGDAAESEPDGR